MTAVTLGTKTHKWGYSTYLAGMLLAGVLVAGLAVATALPVVRPALFVGSLVVLDVSGAIYSARAVRRSAFPLAWRLCAVGRAFSAAALLCSLIGGATGERAWWGCAVACRAVMFLSLGAGAVVGPMPFLLGRRLYGHVAEMVTVFGGGFMMLWFFVLHPLLVHPFPDGHRLVYVGFAIGDLVLAIGVVSVVLCGALVRPGSPLTLYVVGLFLLVISDAISPRLAVEGVYDGSSAIAALTKVVASLLLTAASMIVCSGWVTPMTDRVLLPPSWSLYVPQVLLAGICAVLLTVIMRSSGLSLWAGLLGGLVVMTAGVVIRQSVALRDLRARFTSDPLTGLPNRAGFEEAAETVVRGGRCTVLLLNLDGFRLINDASGHRVGDAVLVEVSRRLRAAVRNTDLCARLNGDEFALLVHDIGSETEAGAAAQRVLETVNSRRLPVDMNGTPIRGSVGVAFAEAACPVLDLLHQADVALYHAKRSGTHGFMIHDPTMIDRRARDAALSDDLDTALENGQLQVVYQPMVDLADGCALGAEALLRWRHPVRGDVSPDIFIPVAERSGVINEIGLWVLEQACSQLLEWLRRGPADPPRYVSVNLSPRQLWEPSLVSDVLAVLFRTGLPAQRLVLEVTESAIVDERESIATLTALRSHGVRIAIDDFGTGYSSLQYLTRLPVDILKIDRAFVARLDGTAEGSAIAEAVLRLSQALHLATVAEGIETAAQAAELRLLGCDVGQGYRYARPAPPREITAMMTAARGEIGSPGEALRPEQDGLPDRLTSAAIAPAAGLDAAPGPAPTR